MLATRARTERPHGALLQSGTGARCCTYRIGGRRRNKGASSYGANGGIPPLQHWVSNRLPLPAAGQYQAGSLTGAVASERVSEALKGSLMMDGNHQESAKAEGSLTVTPTGGAGTKVGLSDPVVESGIAIAQRIKATLGITGLSLPRVHIDGVVWHLDVGSSHPGAVAGPKGWAVRPLKRYASWVQNVVRQFGPYPARAEEI